MDPFVIDEDHEKFMRWNNELYRKMDAEKLEKYEKERDSKPKISRPEAAKQMFAEMFAEMERKKLENK